MTDKVQKIREEVEKIARSINPYIPDEEGKNSEYEAGRFAMVIQIMQIIDSMQEEPIPKFKVGDTIRNVDSGELFHIEKVDGRNYWDGRDSFYIIHQDCWELVEEPLSEDFKQFEKAYLEKKKDEILSVYDRHAGLVDGARWQRDHDGLPVSEELEKAANEWNKKASFQPIYMVMEGDRPVGTKQDITTHGDSFKAGAQWQRRQMMKDAVEVDVWNEKPPHITYFPKDLKGGDKVKLIIIKKD